MEFNQTSKIPTTPATEPSVIKPKLPKGRPVWVTATGSRVTRIKKARTYLRKHAWVPRDNRERHAALFTVMANLRLYFQLPIELAITMVQEHYTERFLNAGMAALAFDNEEVRTEYRRAGETGVYPSLGVSDPKAKAVAARMNLQKEIRRFHRRHLAPGGTCTPSDVHAAFIEFRGGTPISAIVFGRELAHVTGIRRKTPFGVPTYPGVHLVTSTRARKKAA